MNHDRSPGKLESRSCAILIVACLLYLAESILACTPRRGGSRTFWLNSSFLWLEDRRYNMYRWGSGSYGTSKVADSELGALQHPEDGERVLHFGADRTLDGLRLGHAREGVPGGVSRKPPISPSAPCLIWSLAGAVTFSCTPPLLL